MKKDELIKDLIDLSKGKLNNINKWENPIMTPIDGFIRTEY